MKNHFIKAALLAPLGFVSLSSMAGTSLSLAGVGNFADAKLPEQIDNGGGVTIDKDDKFGMGLAALISSQGSSAIGFETGAILVNRKFRYGSTNYNFTQSQLTLQVPVLLRAYFGQFFSVGAGPFVSLPIGGVKNTFTVGGSTTSPFTIERDVIELGVQAAASAGLPVTDTMAAFVEGRYTYGMAALNTDSDKSSKTNDLSALLGVRITL